jgi:hypothetical protein
MSLIQTHVQRIGSGSRVKGQGRTAIITAVVLILARMNLIHNLNTYLGNFSM